MNVIAGGTKVMSFEFLDNLFQVTTLGCASIIAAVSALRRKNRRCLILALAYACFSMGTLYYVLSLAILGHTPRVFYVSEVSWLAAWLFYLSLQLVRTEGMKPRFSPLSVGGALPIAVCVLTVRIFGPSYLMSSLFALTVGAVVFLSLFRLQSGAAEKRTDAALLVCVLLQLLLYAVSGFTRDYTRFNLYFVVDIALTLSMVALLPLMLREVTKK